MRLSGVYAARQSQRQPLSLDGRGSSGDFKVVVSWPKACSIFIYGFHSLSQPGWDLPLSRRPKLLAKQTMTPAPIDELRSGSRFKAAVVVAHPDDETLWCGGYILTHPEFLWRIVTLCRGADPDRAPRFREVLHRLGAEGEMADLDDGPDQAPLPAGQVQETTARLLAGSTFDLILTHGPHGEYTRHRRHRECCLSVIELWRSGGIDTERLWLFAYEDGGRAYLPRVRDDAARREVLTDGVWLEKYRMITDIYGFGRDSWEAQTTPREEGFCCFDSAQAAVKHAARRGQSS